MPSVIMLYVIILSIIMLSEYASIIAMSVILLEYNYAECLSVKNLHAECQNTGWHCAECLCVACGYGKSCYAECNYSGFHYSECQGALFAIVDGHMCLNGGVRSHGSLTEGEDPVRFTSLY
jgi:hypothetical protein